ncbi:MAG: metal-dependent hydrolase [Leptospiraceae bacterium]|nr:metal-dependent hydrolase [Leptospiraceae bacterium]MCP5494016.1 metal-dependent hydrolase [Leptospiraceae bacterium]
MASAFSHGFLAFFLGKAFNYSGWKVLSLGIFCSVLPDIDVIAFKFGIPYAHPFGHRGFTHSIFFAIVLSVTIKVFLFYKEAFFTKKSCYLILFFFLATLSHGVLDAATNGGLGVAFFFPIDNTRYFFTYRPIQVSPIGIKNFLSEWGFRVVLSEIKFVVFPTLFFFLIIYLIKKLFRLDRNI